MIRLIKAKIIARETVKTILQKEIPMINMLIEEAKNEGRFTVPINVNDYSSSTQTLLKKAGYNVEYDYISLAHVAGAFERNEKELMKIAKEAGVSILDVQ